MRPPCDPERSGRIADLANLGSLNAMVRAVAVTPPTPASVDKGNLSALNESFLVDVAQTRAVLGFKAGDLRRSPDVSAAYVEAAAARIRGGATLDQEKLLADTVVTGTVAKTVHSPRKIIAVSRNPPQRRRPACPPVRSPDGPHGP